MGIEKMLVTEFEEYNVSKMIYPIIILDEINVLLSTNNLDPRLEKTESFKGMHFFFDQFSTFF